MFVNICYNIFVIVMKKAWLVIFFFFLGICNVNALNISTDVKLKSCIDGDTTIFIINDIETKVRFLAVNAPEKDSEQFGNDASEYVCSLLTNASNIIIEFDKNATTDKYNRTLAWIWIDGKLLQQSLIEEGLAEVAYIYDSYKYTESLCLIQKEAINKQKNIWSIASKEEDYCAGIDTSNVQNNIDFQTLTVLNEDNNEYTEEDLQKVIDGLQKAQDTISSINNTTGKIANYLTDNKEEMANIIVYIMLGIAGIYLLLKSISTFKK